MRGEETGIRMRMPALLLREWQMLLRQVGLEVNSCGEYY